MPNKNAAPFFFGDSLPERKSFDMGNSFITLNTSDWRDYVSYGTYGGHISYEREAGRLDHNAIVMACINFAKRAFPEAPIQVLKRTPDGGVPVPEHALTALILNPNPYYNGILLWRATIASMILSGNAYWLKVRNGSGQLIELWYEPHTTCRPVGSDSEFISHYEVYRRGRWLEEPQFRFAREDVIHFRGDLDPDNPRLGLSDLAAALREVFTDNEAAAFSATVLRNTGAPGVVISPTGESIIDDPEGLKRAVMAKTQGEHRGEPLVVSTPLKMDKMAFSPADMNLEALRRIPEERISGLIGIPAIVAGLGAGLDRSTFANMAEAREHAYEGFIIPTQQLLAQDLDNQLLPDMGNPAAEYVAFDLSQVRVLQEDQKALAEKWVTLVRGGVGTIDEARASLGLARLQNTQKDTAGNITDPVQIRLAAQAGFITVNEARASFGLPPMEGGEVPLPALLGALGAVLEPTTEPPAASLEGDVPGEMPEIDIVKALTNGKNGIHKTIGA